MTQAPLRLHWRTTPISISVLLTLLLVPMWLKLPGAPPPFTAFYLTGFAVALPALFTVVWWCLAGLPGLRLLLRDPLRILWMLALLLLTLWGIAARGWAYEALDHPGVAHNGALQISLVALFAIAAASAGPRASVVTGVLVVGVALNAGVVILQAAAQQSIGLALLGEFRLTPTQNGVSVLLAGDLRWLRPYGLTSHPNIAGGFLAVGLLASAGWILAARRWMRWIGVGVFLVGLLALLLTFSRGAWLGFAAGAVVLLPLLRGGWWVQRTLRRTVLFTLGAALLLAGVFAGTLFPLVAARTGVGVEGTEQRSVADRVVYNDIAYRVLMGEIANPRTRLRSNLLFGLGVGNFPWYAADYLWYRTDYDLRGDNVHHVLLLVFTEVGLVGLLLLALALCSGVEAALRGLRQRRQQIVQSAAATNADDRAAYATVAQHAALLAGVVALAVIGVFDHYPWSMLHFALGWWALLGLALAPPRPDPAGNLMTP